MLGYFKLKLIRGDSDDAGLWVTVAAKSIGEAIVKTDEAFADSSYRICDATMAEISEEEFLCLQRQSIHVTTSICPPLIQNQARLTYQKAQLLSVTAAR
ncbi:hypothetical protein FVR03_20275 [Pontibacter qinzhouensis]|uniref:Uncharacterized protein n=1 Tax=Pontibacter qinzhouensis TaxID=2603253 RepID=A0A5C8J4F9_9BACT|nr:hypothetical protein [Pontibacter qinzhouensis]TXK29859.1 hypothetical protein FVR03_20275 [Pontibacter qinzhouensis]